MVLENLSTLCDKVKGVKIYKIFLDTVLMGILKIFDYMNENKFITQAQKMSIMDSFLTMVKMIVLQIPRMIFLYIIWYLFFSP